MKYKESSSPEKWLKIGIPVLFAVGFVMHFLYDLTGKSALIGIFAPVNESVWEHLKLLLLPMLVWWGAYYIICGRRYNIDKEKWFFGNVIALITSIITLIAFYYIYTQILGIESLLLDIFDLLLSLAVGQYIGIYAYKHCKGIMIEISILMLISIMVVFGLFTFYPPHTPIFKDSTTGKYGIQIIDKN